MGIDFSKSSKEAILHAYNEASRFKSVEIIPEHLFLGIVKTDDQTRNLLLDLGVKVDDLICRISTSLAVQQNDKRNKDIDLSKAVEKIIKVASLEAQLLRQDLIEPYHILLSILRESSNFVHAELEKFGLESRIRKEIGYRVESGLLKSKKGFFSRWLLFLR